jgi:hypothetical protein
VRVVIVERNDFESVVFAKGLVLLGVVVSAQESAEMFVGLNLTKQLVLNSDSVEVHLIMMGIP